MKLPLEGFYCPRAEVFFMHTHVTGLKASIRGLQLGSQLGQCTLNNCAEVNSSCI